MALRNWYELASAPPGFSLWIKKDRLSTVSYSATSRSPESIGADPVFSKMHKRFTSSARVQNLCRDKNYKAQGRNCLVHDHMAGWCQSQPNPGVHIPSLSYKRLSQVGRFWMRNCIKTQRVCFTLIGGDDITLSLPTLRSQITGKKIQTKNSW